MPFARKPDDTLTESAIESRIRRAAEKAGLRAVKSRWRRGTVDNRGGWQVINPDTNFIIHGERFDLDDAETLAWLEEQ